MPLYELFIVLRPNLKVAQVADLMQQYARRVVDSDGILTGIKYFGKQPLAKRIRTLLYKKAFNEGFMMQLTFMQPPQVNRRLQFEIQNDDRIYRWNLHRYHSYGPRYLDPELLESYAKMLLLQEDAAKGTSYAGLTREEAQRILDTMPEVDLDAPEVREKLGLFGEPIAPRLVKKVKGPFEEDKKYIEWNRPI